MLLKLKSLTIGPLQYYVFIIIIVKNLKAKIGDMDSSIVRIDKKSENFLPRLQIVEPIAVLPMNLTS